ncbi:trans-3-hydroxy-L-proline dehydratase [Arthrobacter sp. efr-133-TYG-118]|uniref:trans-3-hydroxy-L-proline dehydratase n=1 Tax=Arthrobacter sp. efr-133-TYG-118 TaxID=3040279 RepID=UPI002549D745|nr:trans-3-hydroxy-L-proline dehydratase [Arthrobacter sp. efr-133-TYG-118]
MKTSRLFTTVEAHTGGAPFRIVTSGGPRVPGKTILERCAWVQENADEIRRALMLEPRGHSDMYGGMVTEPVSEGADLGIIFMQNVDYSAHCGHGIIALATAAVELGWVKRTSPETRVGIDASCGFIEAFVEWDGTHVSGVRFVNVPSFIWKENVTVETPSFGAVTGDIAYGGVFYFYTDGAPFGLTIREKDADRLKDFGMEVKNAVNAKYDIVHPEEPEIKGLYGTIIAGPARDVDSTQANACIYADRELDRSPTGSGTAGRTAQLFLQGKLARDEVLINESIIGSVFEGRVLTETRVGEYDAVIPEIRGNAFIHGFANWVMDDRDPLTGGFSLTR